MRWDRLIADFYYDKRLTDIENGLPVHMIGVYLSDNGDYFEYIGANTGLIRAESIEDIIEKFGKPILIEYEKRNWGYEFDYIGKYADKNKADQLSFRALKAIKNGEFINGK